MQLFVTLAAFAALFTPVSPAVPAPGVAVLSAEADAVIRKASAQGHFINDTRKDFPAVRHTASGLRCLFQPGRSDNAIVWIGPTAGKGGVACRSRPVGLSQTLEAIQLAPGETLDSVFQKSVVNITSQQPEARAYAGGGISVRVAPSSGLAPAEPKTAGYLVSRDGQEVFSRVSVALVNGWIIRQQFEAPAAHADQAELLAGVVMSTTLIDLATRTRDAQAVH